MVWLVPSRGEAGAEFESTQAAEKVLLDAGFKFIAEERGFRA
jgi:hypothetical protein